ncbi:hypothetical protein HNY73_015619 [Argiope bruennichi]|uniref:C2H2-type domain-containing protein n=1 Tax=Argiope bruennichi TaxID=94029 RepID=A0A8T0EXE6_ARGBR|nr:hypothetical protein HNY73_015619 [Argiope bruennichi]
MYVCHICGVKNTSLTPFAKHLFQHLSQLCYICFPCTDFLTSRFQKSYMTNNVFFVSEKNSFEPSEDESSERTTHLCGECHNWFPDYKDFFLHLHVHKQELYQCPTCVLSFPTNIEHIHVDKLPAFNCLRCKSTFVADPKCNIFEPLIFCNIEKLSSHEPDMRVINQLVKEFKLCFTIKNRSKENSIIANSITSTSHVKSFSKENLSNLITNSSLKANAKPVKSFNKKQVSLKIHNGGHNSKYISPEREILNSSNVAHSINSSTHDKKDSCKTCFEGNAFSDSFSMNNSLCSSTSFHSPSSCGSPEIHHCMKQHGKNTTIQPPKLNSSEMVTQVSSSRNYCIVKSVGNKLVLKLQDSKPGSKLMNPNQKDSFNHTIIKKNKVKANFPLATCQANKHKKYTLSEECCITNLNSKVGSKLLLNYHNEKDSLDCIANQKKETTQTIPYTTYQLNNHIKNASLDISRLSSQETTSVSFSIPVSSSSVSSSIPLIQSNMPISNSSHILKNTKGLHRTLKRCNLKSKKVDNSEVVNTDKAAQIKPKRSRLTLNNQPCTKNNISTPRSKVCAQNSGSYTRNCHIDVLRHCLCNICSIGRLRFSGNLNKSSHRKLSNYDRSKKKRQNGEKLISNSDISNGSVTNPLLGNQINVEKVCFNLNEYSPVDFKRNPQKLNEEKVGSLANTINSLYKQSSNKCLKISPKRLDGRSLPKVTEVFYVAEDSSKHQIQQTVDYPAVPYKDMIECKSYANDAEGNNSLLTIRSCLSSPVKTVEVIPNKEISENSALLKKVCSKIFLNSSVSGNSSLWTNSDVLRNHETPSRNIAKSLYNQNLETDAIASTDSFLISNDTELLKKKVLKNSENNQLALIDSQSVKNFDAGHDNLYIQNSLTPVNDVQTQTIEVSGENHDIMHSSDNLILQKNSNSKLDGNGAVYLSGLKVGDTILINYNQNKEIAKNLYPFRKFQASDTDGWLSIPVELLTPLDCKQNEAVCSNNSPIHGNFSMISDQNKVIDDIYLQSISTIESRKQQDVSLNSLQCVNISASDGFQNNQHSVNLETLGSLSIGDSQPELNNSELLNNENLKSSSYSNNNAPKYHDNFQNSTKPVSISLCNRSDNLNYNISVDEKCMNNDLFDVDQNYKCSKVANIDGFPADLNNLKPLANENTQNTIYPNLMPPEHKVGGNINSETNSGCQKSVRSPGSKDYDRAELFDYEDVLIENPLLKDSKADPIHFNCLRSENNDSTKSVERGSVSIPDSTNNNSKSGTEKNHCSTKNEKANQVLNNSKKLLVGLTKLPHYVRSYRTYKIYERSQKRKLALQKKKKLKSANKIISNLGNGLLSAPLENDSLAIGNCINVHNASTLIDTETVGKESNFQLQSSCGASPTELISISHPTNLHTMENSETIENDFVSLDYLNQQPLKTPVFNSHVKEEFNICNQKFVEQAKTPIVSTSVGAETSYINNGSQLLPSYICPPDVANKYSTDLHTVEYGSVVGNYASLHRLNYQSVVTPVSLPKSCVKQQLDFYNQQSTEEIESPVIMCDNNESYRILVSDSNQTYAQSTPNSNELNSCQLSVPLTNTSELNSCHQQVASLTENSKSCDNLFESELLDIEQVPVLITDSSSSTNNTSCLEMLHMSYQVNNKSRCNLVSPHLPSTSDSFYLMSNYQNNFDAECYQKSLENMDAFCLWKTEYQLKYLKDRIKHINETLVKVESRQNVKFLEPRILLYKLPDSVYEKYLKKKPIMLTNILPIITDVHSLSSEKNGLFKI